MSKYLITADLHLTDSTYDAYRWDIFGWLASRAKMEKVDAIFILGDLTNNKDRHSAYLVNRLTTSLIELSATCPVVVLKGNHDYVDQHRPFFSFVNAFQADVDFIVSPTTYWHDESVFFVPHTANPRSYFQENIKQLRKAKLVCIHQPLKDAVAGNGQVIRNGMPTQRLDLLRAKVVAGDIHVPQKVDSVTYAGAPYPINFGDDYQPRVLVWDGSRRKLKSIKRLSIKKSVVSVREPEDLHDEGLNLDEDDQVKLVVKLRRRDVSSWREKRAAIMQECEDMGLVVRGIEMREISKKQKLSSKKSGKATDPTKIVTEFCEKFNLDDSLLEVGQSVVEGLRCEAS
jgi:predicted phosphodiesterase